MNLHNFKVNEPESFKEAVSDIDWDKVSDYLAKDNNASDLSNYLADHFESYREAVSEPDHDAAYDDKRQQKIDNLK